MNVQDSRTLESRIDALKAEREAYAAENDGIPYDSDTYDEDRGAEWDATEEGEELAALTEARDDIGSEWRSGVTLIDCTDFQEYARELAEDIGAIPNRREWPCTCIDWERAAKELQSDYSIVSIQGTDYFYRA